MHALRPYLSSVLPVLALVACSTDVVEPVTTGTLTLELVSSISSPAELVHVAAAARTVAEGVSARGVRGSTDMAASSVAEGFVPVACETCGVPPGAPR